MNKAQAAFFPYIVLNNSFVIRRKAERVVWDAV